MEDLANELSQRVQIGGEVLIAGGIRDMRDNLRSGPFLLRKHKGHPYRRSSPFPFHLLKDSRNWSLYDKR